MANLAPEDRNAKRRATTICKVTLVLHSSRTIADILHRHIDIVNPISITHIEIGEMYVALYQLICSQLVVYRFRQNWKISAIWVN